MAQENINIGTPNGENGDLVRDAFSKTQNNFTEIYSLLDNKGKVRTYTTDGTGLIPFVNAVNNGTTFTVAEDQEQYFLFYAPDDLNPELNSLYVTKMINKGKGIYGNGGSTALGLSDILILGKRPYILSIEESETTQFIDLGDIGSDDIVTAFNAHTFTGDEDPIQEQGEGYVLIDVIIDSEPLQYLFVGVGGEYGTGGTETAIEDDFVLLTGNLYEGITNTSDLINDGEDGVNPFITALDVPSLEIYSESGTLAGGDGIATIGDLNPDPTLTPYTGSGIGYNQAFLDKGVFKSYIHSNADIIDLRATSGGSRFHIDSSSISLTANNIPILINSLNNNVSVRGSQAEIRSTNTSLPILLQSTSGMQLLDNTGNRILNLSIANITNGTNTQSFQDKSGTIALLSDIPSGGLDNVVEDTTPQLGGDLDTQGNSILGNSGQAINFESTYVELESGTVSLYIHSDVENVELQGGDFIIANGFVQADNFVSNNGTTSSTGLTLNLSDNIAGQIFNEATPLVYEDDPFDVDNLKTGGYVINYIDTTGSTDFPAVTNSAGAEILTKGDAFREDAIFKMVVSSPNGVDVEYFFVDYLNTSGGGNFIPLSGTEVGSPVTGDIEYDGYDLWPIKYLDPNGDMIDIGIWVDDGNFFFRGFDGTYTLDFGFGGGTVEYLINGDNPLFKGLIGGAYYGANYDLTDTNVYPQIGFVASLFPIETADTGTVISLTTSGGNLCNMASANDETTYTTTGTVLNAYAKVLINASTQPSVTGATLRAGATFVADTDMYMVVSYNGVIVEYYFLEL